MVTKQEIYSARGASLYDYLLKNHGNAVKREGNELRLKQDNSVVITRGYFGYKDYSTGVHKNAIDLLTDYFDYDFENAVLCLLGVIPAQQTESTPEAFKLPKQGDNKARKVFEYLESRCIDANTIQMLIDMGLLYEDIEQNCVFVSKNLDYYEARGTRGEKWCQCKDKSEESINCWFFHSPDLKSRPEKAYITESAIDCISLYLLRRENAFFVSIGGIANKQRVNKFKSYGLELILAFDNDESGKKWREFHSDLKSIVPHNKDWNEDLKQEN